MKPKSRKPKAPPPRNPFVVLAHKRKAGTHRKPEKALRRAQTVATQRDLVQVAEHFCKHSAYKNALHHFYAPLAHLD